VPYPDIGKGYEMPDGRMVILTNEDFAELPLPTAKSIEVLEFVPAKQVDPLFFAKAYYLAADSVGAKPYILFRDALTKTKQCALVKVAIRTRETLALLRERDGALVLQTMLWPDEVRDSEFARPDDSVEVRKQEVGMAESYIAALQADFDPSRYHSDYREALEQLVEAKAAGLPMPEGDEEEETAEVVDLVAALRASVDAAKKRRGESSGSSSEADSSTSSRSRSSGTKKAAAKKSTTKAPAKKTAVKKATVKKAAAKKSA
jgi:DNA end-binding protein Ku